ncbi:stage V sporulation protein AB [Gorillibacterium timonense]|uniref:stage V sporulation protein AB n=1 Tax=Gorillibacterium timonense TaxID=1689269 RepID=UPI00071D7B9E|nr:stage V sporulation protein AB [Gorillibacterium timonense]
MAIVRELGAAFVGLAWGLAVGSGFVAFIAVLDILPRLAQVTRTYATIRLYERALIAGSVYWTLADLYSWMFPLHQAAVTITGLLSGMFVGLLAGGLTEVVNVLPILAKRLGLASHIGLLLFAMILGKVIGSLFEWLFY